MKGKGNLAKQGLKTLAYKIAETFIEVNGKPYVDLKGRPVGVPRIEWDGETDHDIEDVLSADSDPLKKGSKKAEEFLKGILDAEPSGTMLASEIYQAGEIQSPPISAQKMKRAKDSLEFEAFKLDRWYWAKSSSHAAEFKKNYFSTGTNKVILSKEVTEAELPF